MKSLHFERTRRQKEFINAKADEVLFGGAAGGGKSFGQFLDAVMYAMKYPNSKQIIFRRTYPELEQSMIRTFRSALPKELFKYNATKHTGIFSNGSIIDFGYIDKEADVYRYQSAEFDVIRFDELTHFTEGMYIYLISRLRGTNPYPRAMKSTTNPGGIGHTWVKARFIDPAPPDTVFEAENGTRVFLPAKIQDNGFLMKGDPSYLRRLENLPEREKKALLHGEWDIFDGQYFDNFDRTLHITEPVFNVERAPQDWEFYIALDYGLDMLAAYLCGVSPRNEYHIIREFYDGNQHPDGNHKGLIISEAAKAILALEKGFSVQRRFAPPDLWGRSKDTGKSVAEIFRENGVTLWRVDNSRVAGWMEIKEMLEPKEDLTGGRTAQLKIWSSCRHLIRTLPSLAVDPHNPNDAAKEPHELTHAPDALRYFIAGRPRPKAKAPKKPRYDFEFQKPPTPIGIGEKIKPV